ncbi:hypothetical protein [Frankia sp. CiP3]|uniref:hypothetical protein n=1 Tax=Frankia sp. CiP3 TaxID=2880971 RepID=UPI001EF737D6|nr:hypothetical protein [Frankia sp. CiP3]
MIEGLAKSLIEPLSAHWRNASLGAAASLWLTFALLFVLSHNGAADCARPGGPWCRVADNGSVGSGLILLAAAGLVIGTAFLAAGLAPGLVAAMTADFWICQPPPLSWVCRLSIRWQRGKRGRLAARCARLSSAAGSGNGFKARRKGAVYSQLISRYPTEDEWLRSSTGGNILAAISQKINDRLGLDLTHVWQPLVGVLSDGAADELETDSTTIAKRCQQMLIALVAFPLAGLLPWLYAVPWLALALVALVASRQAAIAAVATFAEHAATVVIIHRMLLYTALRVQPPSNPAAEVASGRQLSQLLASFHNLDASPSLIYL